MRQSISTADKTDPFIVFSPMASKVEENKQEPTLDLALEEPS